MKSPTHLRRPIAVAFVTALLIVTSMAVWYSVSGELRALVTANIMNPDYIPYGDGASVLLDYIPSPLKDIGYCCVPSEMGHGFCPFSGGENYPVKCAPDDPSKFEVNYAMLSKVGNVLSNYFLVDPRVYGGYGSTKRSPEYIIENPIKTYGWAGPRIYVSPAEAAYKCAEHAKKNCGYVVVKNIATSPSQENQAPPPQAPLFPGMQEQSPQENQAPSPQAPLFPGMQEQSPQENQATLPGGAILPEMQDQPPQGFQPQLPSATPPQQQRQAAPVQQPQEIRQPQVNPAIHAPTFQGMPAPTFQETQAPLLPPPPQQQRQAAPVQQPQEIRQPQVHAVPLFPLVQPVREMPAQPAPQARPVQPAPPNPKPRRLPPSFQEQSLIGKFYNSVKTFFSGFLNR